MQLLISGLMKMYHYYFDRCYSTIGAFDSPSSRCILNSLFIFFTEYFTNDLVKEDEVTVIYSTNMRDEKSIQHKNLKV
jgi:hypothetical protein